MSDTVFVTMYHPALGNIQVDAPLQAVPTYQSHGWLLLDPNATPPPIATPYLTQAAGDSRYVRDWAGAEVLTAGSIRMSPGGQVLVRTADGTTRSSYDVTEQAAWTTVGGGASDASIAALVPGPSATATALRAAYVPFWTAAETVTTGTVRVDATGHLITANSNRTTRSSYDATEQAAWTVVSGGGGAVASVNGHTGTVSLAAADVNADPAGAAAGMALIFGA